METPDEPGTHTPDQPGHQVPGTNTPATSHSGAVAKASTNAEPAKTPEQGSAQQTLPQTGAEFGILPLGLGLFLSTFGFGMTFKKRH